MINPMTKRRISQYNSLKCEIIMLEDQIYSAETSGDIVTDVVRGSKKQLPYAVHNIAIKGYGSQDIPKLAAQKARCIAECNAIEKFIESIEDSILRQLFTRRFIENRSIGETAALVGYSEKHVARLINRYFEKMSDNVR